jgi:hypothetical protein
MSAIIAGCRERFPRAQTRLARSKASARIRKSRAKKYFCLTSEEECAPNLLRIELKGQRNNHVN